LLRPFIAIGFLSVATAAFAEPVPVDGDDLKKSIPGSLVEIDTPLGTKMPIRFSADGLIAAEAGDLAPILGSAKDRGRWWVEGDKLCSKFFRWFDAEPRCISLARDGSRLYWRKDDGETGTATIVEQGGPDGPAAKSPTVLAKAEKKPAKSEPIKTAGEAPNKNSVVEPAKAAEIADAEPMAQKPPIEAPSVSVPLSRPAMVASADGASPSATPQDGPGMKFGGTGLLDASSRVGPQGPVRPLEKRASAPKKEKRPAQVKSDPPKKVAKKETVVSQLPAARDETATRSAAASAKAPLRPMTASEMYAAAEGVRAREVAAASASVQASRYRVTGVGPGDVLNVRRGPSEQHEQIAGIPPKGRSVEIIGRCYADWCPVRYGKIKGWVNSYYLAAEGARVGSSSPVYVAKP
jgi:hypothetical protein